MFACAGHRASGLVQTTLAGEKNRLAAQVMEHWAGFQESLSSQRCSYPMGKFEVFWNSAKRYGELTKADPLIHRAVAAGRYTRGGSAAGVPAL